MRNHISIILLAVLSFYIGGCSGVRKLNPQDPYPQASVKVTTMDSRIREGIVIQKKGDLLYYVDSGSHKKDSLNFSQIRKLEPSRDFFDFDGYPMPVTDIKKTKGMKKMFFYGSGGLILGAFTGAGVGIGLIAAGVDLPVVASMAAFGLGGAWMFGAMGSDKDFEDATYKVRHERYEFRKAQMKKMLEEERKKLEQQKRQKEELLKQKD